jgi:hypothetical protein
MRLYQSVGWELSLDRGQYITPTCVADDVVLILLMQRAYRLCSDLRHPSR